MKNFVDYTSIKCFASARVASPRLRNITHTRKISFSGLVIQITIDCVRAAAHESKVKTMYRDHIRDPPTQQVIFTIC
jgi:hypothetical protein